MPVGIHDFEATRQAFDGPRRREAALSHLLSLGLDQSSGGCLNFPITVLVDQRVYFLTDPREAAVAKVAKGVFSHTAG